MRLHEYNEEILNTYNRLDCKEELTKPLLVSPELVYGRNVLYIGKEPNGWSNKTNLYDLENDYYNFMINGALNTNFWRYIKDITDINNVVWNNAFICGDSKDMGLTPYYELIKDMSIDYLIFLYNIIKPQKTIIVSGPNCPYYDVINEFNKAINSNIVDNYPTVRNPIVYDENKGIYYTYHPKYLSLSKKTEYTKNIIKK